MNKSNTNKSHEPDYLTLAQVKEMLRTELLLDDAGIKEALQQYEDEHPIDEEDYELTGAIEGLNS